MMELRPVRIILISLYCFLVGLFFLSVTVNVIFGNNGITDIGMWMPVGVGLLSATILIASGIGILYYNRFFWRTLFFFLIICIATVVSLVLVVLAFILLDISLFYKIYQNINIAPTMWIPFLMIFTSGIIVLYYLTRQEIIFFFGDMGELIEPF